MRRKLASESGGQSRTAVTAHKSLLRIIEAVCRRASANALLRRQGGREAVCHRGRGRELSVARWNSRQQHQRQQWRWERKIRTSSDPGQALEWSGQSHSGARRAERRRRRSAFLKRVVRGCIQFHVALRHFPSRSFLSAYGAAVWAASGSKERFTVMLLNAQSAQLKESILAPAL